MRKQREDYRRRWAGLQAELQNLKLQRDDIETSAATSSPTTNSFLKENKRLQVSAAQLVRLHGFCLGSGRPVEMHRTAIVTHPHPLRQRTDVSLPISIALSTAGSLFVCRMRGRLSPRPERRRDAATRERPRDVRRAAVVEYTIFDCEPDTNRKMGHSGRTVCVGTTRGPPQMGPVLCLITLCLVCKRASPATTGCGSSGRSSVGSAAASSGRAISNCTSHRHTAHSLLVIDGGW